MGRLEDIIARNQKALRSHPGLFSVAYALIEDILDPTQPPEDRRRKTLAAAITVGITLAAILALLVSLGPSGSLGSNPPARVGRRVAGIEVWARRGDRVDLASLWREHRLFVVFYPSLQCVPCNGQLNEMNTLRKELDGTLIVVTFDYYLDVEPLRDRLGLGFELYVGGSVAAFASWNLPWQRSDKTGPATFVVEPGGEIVYERTCSDVMTCNLADELRAAAHTRRR